MDCTTDTIVRGQDCELTINLKDKTGAIIDASLFSKMVIIIKHANGTIIAKFSKNTASGYSPIDMTAGATGKVIVKLLSSHTMASPEGKLLYEVHGVVSDATLLDDSVLDLISTNNYLCNIINSITGGTVLP
jgi:hypothetical protein